MSGAQACTAPLVRCIYVCTVAGGAVSSAHLRTAACYDVACCGFFVVIEALREVNVLKLASMTDNVTV